MIKEKKKITKYNYKKTKKKIILEYLRTILFSILVALIITISLSIHARNEIIKDINTTREHLNKIDKKLAETLIKKTNYIIDLNKKSFNVCIHIGDLYTTAGDFVDAEVAYKYAIQKSPLKNYKAYLKLTELYIMQEKFDLANDLINSIKDFSNKNLIKYKTRAHISMGDKYYAISKPLSAAKNYEKADFYYSKFSKSDKTIKKSIKERIINSYIETADIMVKSGKNSEAVRFLNKALKYDENNLKIKYKLAIIYVDLDPEKSVEYLEFLLKKIPQEIDYAIYGRALINAANYADLDNRPTRAKYYRYKIHSIDMFVNRKVIYKNDINIQLKTFLAKKKFFKYPLNFIFDISNYSNSDMINLKADFILLSKNKEIETISKTLASKDEPLFSNEIEPKSLEVCFKKKIYSKKDLNNYTIKIYAYKDEKFKTLISEFKIPQKSIKRKYGVLIEDLDFFE